MAASTIVSLASDEIEIHNFYYGYPTTVNSARYWAAVRLIELANRVVADAEQLVNESEREPGVCHATLEMDIKKLRERAKLATTSTLTNLHPRPEALHVVAAMCKAALAALNACSDCSLLWRGWVPPGIYCDLDQQFWVCLRHRYDMFSDPPTNEIAKIPHQVAQYLTDFFKLGSEVTSRSCLRASEHSLRLAQEVIGEIESVLAECRPRCFVCGWDNRQGFLVEARNRE